MRGIFNIFGKFTTVAQAKLNKFIFSSIIAHTRTSYVLFVYSVI